MHHMSALSRRSLVTSAATLPALALPAVAVAAVNLPAWQAPALVEQSTKPDRIFAAIEAHRNSIIEMFRADRAYFDLNCNTPEYAAAVAAARPFSDAHTDRENELVATTPTSMAGVLALVAYIDDLYACKVALPEEPTQWYTNPGMFSEGWELDEVVWPHNGKPLNMPMIFWIMRNVREALENLSVQS
jgi:hypothetical protein